MTSKLYIDANVMSSVLVMDAARMCEDLRWCEIEWVCCDENAASNGAEVKR